MGREVPSQKGYESFQESFDAISRKQLLGFWKGRTSRKQFVAKDKIGAHLGVDTNDATGDLVIVSVRLIGSV